MDFSVGPGVAQAIADSVDEARSDEQFLILSEGDKISQTFGRDARYFWLEHDNIVQRIPFELDADPPEGIFWDAYLPMVPQVYGWTCSACSLDWVIRAADIVPDYTRPRAVAEIGYPDQINEYVGLTNANGPGQALMDVLGSYEQGSEQGWLSFDDVYTAAQETTGMMAGSAWCHWIAIRGVQGSNIWIANSAEGYKGVYSVLSRADFERLGPFNCVFLVD